MSGAASTMLLKEDRGAVRILKLNRPEVRNALNEELRTAVVMGTKDKKEGLSAFFEKRKPVFTGE